MSKANIIKASNGLNTDAINPSYSLHFADRDIQLGDEDINQFIEEYSKNLDTSRMSKSQRNAINAGMAKMRENLRGAKVSGTLGNEQADEINITGGKHEYFDPNAKFESKADRYAQEHARNALSKLAKWGYDRSVSSEKKEAEKAKLEASNESQIAQSKTQQEQSGLDARRKAYLASKSFNKYITGDNPADYYNRAIEDSSIFGTEDSRRNAALSYFDKIIDNEKEGSEFAGLTDKYADIVKLRQQYDSAEDKDDILRKMAHLSGSYIEVDDFLKGTKRKAQKKEGEQDEVIEEEAAEWKPGIYTKSGNYYFDKEATRGVNDGVININGSEYEFEDGKPVQYRVNMIESWDDVLSGKSPSYTVRGLRVGSDKANEIQDIISSQNPDFLKYQQNKDIINQDIEKTSNNAYVFNALNNLIDKKISNTKESQQYSNTGKNESLKLKSALNMLPANERSNYGNIKRYSDITKEIKIPGKRIFAAVDDRGNNILFEYNGKMFKVIGKDDILEGIGKIKKEEKEPTQAVNASNFLSPQMTPGFKNGGEIKSKEELMALEIIEAFNSSIAKMQKGGVIGKSKVDIENINQLDSPEIRKGFEIKDWGEEFSNADRLEMLASVGDLASLVASFVPGTGTAVTLGVGAGSDIARAIAKSQRGEDWGVELAKDLGMTAISTIPGLGLTKATKVAKGIDKLAKAMSTMAMVTGAQGIYETGQKIQNEGWKSLGTEDLKNLMMFANGIKNYNVRQGLKKGSKIVGKETEIGIDASGKPVSITSEKAKELNNIKDKAERLKKLKGLVGDKGEVDAGLVESTRDLKLSLNPKKALGTKSEKAKDINVSENSEFTGTTQNTGWGGKTIADAQVKLAKLYTKFGKNDIIEKSGNKTETNKHVIDDKQIASNTDEKHNTDVIRRAEKAISYINKQSVPSESKIIELASRSVEMPSLPVRLNKEVSSIRGNFIPNNDQSLMSRLTGKMPAALSNNKSVSIVSELRNSPIISKLRKSMKSIDLPIIDKTRSKVHSGINYLKNNRSSEPSPNLSNKPINETDLLGGFANIAKRDFTEALNKGKGLSKKERAAIQSLISKLGPDSTGKNFNDIAEKLKAFRLYRQGGVIKASTGLFTGTIDLLQNWNNPLNKQTTPTWNKVDPSKNKQIDLGLDTVSRGAKHTSTGMTKTSAAKDKYNLNKLWLDTKGVLKGASDILGGSDALQVYNSLMANRDTDKLKKYADIKYATKSAADRVVPTVGYNAQKDSFMRNRASDLNKEDIKTSDINAYMAMRNAQNAQSNQILAQNEAEKSAEIEQSKAAERSVLDYNAANRAAVDYENRATTANALNIKNQTLGGLEQQQLQNTQRLREYFADKALQKEQKIEHLNRIKNEYDTIINDNSISEAQNALNDFYSKLPQSDRVIAQSNPEYIRLMNNLKRAQANQDIKREAVRAGVSTKNLKI